MKRKKAPKGLLGRLPNYLRFEPEGGFGDGGRITSRSVVFGCLSAYFSVVKRPVSDRR